MKLLFLLFVIVVIHFIILSAFAVLISFMYTKIRKEGVIFVILQFANYFLLDQFKNGMLFIILTKISVPLLWYYFHLIKDEL